MPSLVTRRTLSGNCEMLFGKSKLRTSWTLYNTASATSVYWNNKRFLGAVDSFLIPPNTAFTLKIPEDDPTNEVWVLAGSAGVLLYVYEGFA